MQRRNKRPRDGQVNYLASVSDLMSALLFVFILTLAVAILQARTAAVEAKNATLRAEAEARNAIQVRQDLERLQKELIVVDNRLTQSSKALEVLLTRIERQLTTRGIPVSIDTIRGVLRVPESAVTFPVGSYRLDSGNVSKVHMIGTVLAQVLQCYQPRQKEQPVTASCLKLNPNGHTLDAVFIEGHTDNQAYRGDTTGKRNRMLSTGRSNAVFDAMISGNRDLLSLTNLNGERLFSLSGYGSARPLPGHEHSTPTDDPANRRIEFRFLLTPPDFTVEERKIIRRKQ